MLPALLPIIIAAAALAAGCGEREFTPDEFVDAANEEGAELALGDKLASITEDVDVYSISFQEAGEENDSAPADDHGHAHGGGSMIVAPDADAAREEFARCEDTVTLTCYRAANIVLYFDLPPEDEHVARTDAAIRALGAE